MSVEMSVSFADAPVAAFLVDPDSATHVVRPAPPSDFNEVGRRDNTRDVERTDAVFPVRELYRLEMNGSAAGVVSADVIKGQTVEVWVEYVVHGHRDLSTEQRERLAGLLDEHDGQPRDLEAWLQAQISDGWIRRDQIVIAGHLHLSKVAAAVDINASQRVALHALYGLDPQRLATRIELLSDESFTHWARNRGSSLVPIGFEPIGASDAADGRYSAEIPASGAGGVAAEAAIGGLLDRVTRVLVPSQCAGGFRRKDARMASVLASPEFKIEWRSATIRVGCARITIPVPIIRTRISNLICFIYYHQPTAADQAMAEIIRICAIRSALTGAVVGIVLGNPAAAMVTFKANFMSCLKEESFACLNPGVYVVKEAGPWI